MMSDLRLSKTITIGPRRITIKEIRPADARMVLADGMDLSAMDFTAMAETFLPMICDGIEPAEIADMGLTAGLALFDAFREVNPGFLDLTRRAGLLDRLLAVADAVKTSLSTAWTEASAVLSGPDIQTPPDTAGPSS